jgi:hypothetical protein
MAGKAEGPEIQALRAASGYCWVRVTPGDTIGPSTRRRGPVPGPPNTARRLAAQDLSLVPSFGPLHFVAYPLVDFCGVDFCGFLYSR